MSEPSKFIPAKRKAKPAKPKVAETTSAELPKDLQDKWGACLACATAFNTMQSGNYTYSYMKALNASLIFLKELHEQTVEDALKHPDAHLIPELKAELDKKEKAEQDGKANEQ